LIASVTEASADVHFALTEDPTLLPECFDETLDFSPITKSSTRVLSISIFISSLRNSLRRAA
jgi:hypothetical protein